MTNTLDRLDIGFTGTRQGMTPDQRVSLDELILWLVNSRFVTSHTRLFLHHGDCVGADAEAHACASLHGIPVIIHPPINSRYRANCENAFSVLPVREYKVRNLGIATVAHFVIGAPAGLADSDSPGTWWTIKAANGMNRAVRVIMPDGSILKGSRRA